MAVALVIFARWNPVYCLYASLLFGGAAALGHYQRARALYQSALQFWSEQKLSKYKRMSRNLERVEEKIRRMT